MRTRLLVLALALGCNSDPVSPQPAVQQTVEVQAPAVTGAWQSLGSFGDAHHRACTVRAWVPTHAEGARLPLLVVLDGAGASRWFRVDETLATLASEGHIEPWIVLAVESASDRDAVLARTDDQLAGFLTQVILPAAEAALPVREGRAQTAILGYSLGGLSALAVAIAAPDRFGRVVAMSPSLWVDERAIMPRVEHAQTLPLRLWIDVGSAEPDQGDLIPYMVSDARNMRDLALYRGLIFGRDVGYLEAMGAGHAMHEAGRRMREALLFALSDRDYRTQPVRSLQIARYPAPSGPGSESSTFAVEARYQDGARLTWPETLVEVYAGESRMQRDIAPLRSRLHVEAFGQRAETP